MNEYPPAESKSEVACFARWRPLRRLPGNSPPRPGAAWSRLRPGFDPLETERFGQCRQGCSAGRACDSQLQLSDCRGTQPRAKWKRFPVPPQALSRAAPTRSPIPASSRRPVQPTFERVSNLRLDLLVVGAPARQPYDSCDVSSVAPDQNGHSPAIGGGKAEVPGEI